MNLNLQIYNNRVVRFDELRSGDVEVTIERGNSNQSFSYFFHLFGFSEEKFIIPKERRCLIADFLVGNQPS